MSKKISLKYISILLLFWNFIRYLGHNNNKCAKKEPIVAQSHIFVDVMLILAISGNADARRPRA